MEHVRGRVLDGNDVLAEDVDITAVVDSRPRSKSWHGCFVVTGPWSSGCVGPLTLQFNDGRSGEILVRKTKDLSSEQTTVFFEGTGALV